VVLVRFRADRRAIEKRSGWIRDPGQSTFVIVVAVLFGGFMLAIAWQEARGLGASIVSVLVAAAWSWFTIARCALSGARVDPEALLIRNPFRTLILPWSDVVRARIGPHGFWPLIAIVDLTDSRSVHVWALQATPRPRAMSRLLTAVERLDAQIRDRRQGGDRTS
jgi:PH (Pleckstrin Homology) domain-containing protein